MSTASLSYPLQLLIAVAAVLAATRAFGWLFARIRQPAVLGEIIAGVVLGGSVLGLVNPNDPILHALSEAGVLILLFEAGLHTEPGALLRAGASSAAVAVVGVVLPFALGYFAMSQLGATWLEAVIASAALCATSVGISARVLAELGRLKTDEGRIVLGAAVIDDVIGLAILAVVMSLVTGGWLSMESILRSLLLPAAFVIGLVMDVKGLNGRVEGTTRFLTTWLVPFFFAVTGALLDLTAMANGHALAIGGALIVCGVLGKLAAGWAAVWHKGDKLLIGVAMIPRGEVGLIFAQMGLASGAIDQGTFGAIMLMVLVTTLITPPALAAIASPPRVPG